MADIASQGQIFINSGAGNGALKQLLKVKNFDAKDNGATEVVMAIGVNRGAGFRRKQGGFEIDMTVYREVSKTPEYDWYEALRVQRTITITTQDEGNGQRRAYTCRVSKIDPKKDAEGNFEDTVSLACTQAYET